MNVIRRTLASVSDGPAVLILDGDAGIGKTTLCLAAITEASDAGLTVLATSGAAAEVSLAWTGIADLVNGVDDDVLAQLSPLHERVLQTLREGRDGAGGDERLVATAFRAAVAGQSIRGPVLVVVDDAQWLDRPSRMALGFTVRRMAGPTAVLVAFRNGDEGSDQSWLQPPRPQALSRLTVGPMNRAALRSMIASRVESVPSPRTTARIHELSGGNPFFALELVRALAERPDTDPQSLPPTLTALVRDRIGDPGPQATEAMVTAAAAFDPTVDTVAAAVGCAAPELVEVIAPLESRGVLVLDGQRIRFTHPLLASGVLTETDTSVRRRVHRRLADVVDHPEQRARHLALSTPHGDACTIAALDAAAESAAGRGAYSTAAELIALALSCGGDDQWRRLRGADYLLRAGALDDADDLLAPIIDDLPGGFMRAAGLMLLAAIRGYRDGMASTIGMLRLAVDEAGDDLALRTQALLVLALSIGIGGDMPTCVDLARRARDDAATTGVTTLRSQALTLWAHVSFMHGLGADSAALGEALGLEEPDASAPIMLRPASIQALQYAWTGRLEDAREMLAAILARSEEVGNDLEVLWAAEQLTMVDVALGRYDNAERTATEALERAHQVGGRLPLVSAHTAIAHSAAYRGRLADAETSANLAVAGATDAKLGYLIRPPTMSLAFAQVSNGRYEAALQTLEPLLSEFDADHDTEMVAGAFLPDAVEALTAVGRGEEAEPLVSALENAGRRHDRTWMLAVGARCRALLLAAGGDLDGACDSAERAMAYHAGLPMPFERARTQLLLGQVLRRRRRTQAAREALSEAAAEFDAIGSPLWAARAHAELTRVGSRSAGAALTEAEQTVARYAAAGQSNKEIAAAAFLSVKTVEMHLSSVYRKLGIRSRSQLAARLRDDPAV